MSTPPVPSAIPRCWFCDAEVPTSRIEHEGVLLPRETARGGPLWILDCPECGTENGAERNRAGDFLLVPREPGGMSGILGLALDRRAYLLRGHARRWFRRNAARRRAFHAAPARARPGTPPAEPPPGPESSSEPPPERIDPGEGSEEGAAAAEAPSLLDHYRRLGVPVTAGEKEVTAAYRALSRKCHPDKVAHLDEEFQRLADRKFRELRESYEAVLEGLDRSRSPDP